jgi:hypothetical protein
LEESDGQKSSRLRSAAILGRKADWLEGEPGRILCQRLVAVKSQKRLPRHVGPNRSKAKRNRPKSNRQQRSQKTEASLHTILFPDWKAVCDDFGMAVGRRQRKNPLMAAAHIYPDDEIAVQAIYIR